MTTVSKMPRLAADATNASVANQIRRLGARHGITCAGDPSSPLANKMAELAGEEVRLDEIELILLELSRAGFVTSKERIQLHTAYLDELSGRH